MTRHSQFVGIQDLLRRFEHETGTIPYEITLAPEPFKSLWSDVRNVATVEWRPGFFCEGSDKVIDTGYPVIEMAIGNGIVRVKCTEPIYQRTLEGGTVTTKDHSE